jgi:flagellar protein FlaG
VPVERVESAVSQISDFVQNFQRDLVFSIDKDSERLVVKVVDSETQEVIRQIPSEEMLRIAKNLDAADSLMLREQA